MSHPVFLIDLASARPPTPLPEEQWPAIAREHINHLTRCIRRILTYTEVKSVSTHIFDSTVLTHAGKTSTMPLEDALQDLKRLPDLFAELETTGVKHPTARGIMAGLNDATPEDNFADFYRESKPTHDIYLFARAPATRAALAAFIASKDVALTSLERKLAESPYLPKKLEELSKRGDRLVWMNSTPRRCERVGDVDHEVQEVFSKWLLSYSSQFGFASLHSLLLDRRIVPAKEMVRSLWDGGVGDDVLGRRVEVLCLQDSQLLRCFSAYMNILGDETAGKSETSRISLVLSGLVRSYGTKELTEFGAFNTPARLITPASTPSIDNSRPPCSSIFAGLIIDLARRNNCLIADFFEVDERDESFTRYQTLLQPLTPLSAALRKVTRTEPLVNYNNSCLPQSFKEWQSWDKLENVKECDIADSAIEASAKFFETYLPALFSSVENDITGEQGPVAGKHAPKKPGPSQNDNMLLSFEGSPDFRPVGGHQALRALVKGVGPSPKSLQADPGTGAKVPDREFIIKQLHAQQDVGHEKNLQASPKSTPKKQVQTPPMSEEPKEPKLSPKSASKFRWTPRSKVVAPSDDEMQKCIRVHVCDKKPDNKPNGICRNREKTAKQAGMAPKTVVRGESSVQAGSSPNAVDDGRDECLVSDGRARRNSVPTKSREIAADPDPVQHTSGVGSCSPEPIITNVLTETDEFASTAGEDEKVTQSGIRALEMKKRKADVAADQEMQSSKRHKSLRVRARKEGKDVSSGCERYHAQELRRGMEGLSACVKDLREEEPRAINEVVWKCVTNLSSLAEILASRHEKDCDMDRIINLNLKIPQAVTAAVQLVLNKVKNDDISPNVVLREMWETFISAFEQAVWHLACSRRTASNKKGKKRTRRHVHMAETILSCTQIMAEFAANSRRQPVSFRNVFSTLFSSAFVHLGRKDSGEPIPEVLSLFKKFEEPIPSTLRTANGDGETNNWKKENQRNSYPHTGGAPYQSQPLVMSSSHGANTATPSAKIPLSVKVSSKITKKRNRASKIESSRIVAQARNKAQKIAIGRSQFAKASEALRNAMNTQTHLPLRSTKFDNKKKLQSNAVGRRGSKGAPSGSTLQDILPSTVPTPMIDDLTADEPGDSVDQTPPPSPQIEENHTALARSTIPGVKGSGSEDIAGAGEDNVKSSFAKEEKSNREQKPASANGNGKQGKPMRAAIEEIGPMSHSDKPSSTFSGRTTRHEAKEATGGQKHVEQRGSINDVDSSPGTTVEDIPTTAKHAEMEESHKEKDTNDKKGILSKPSRRVTRSQVKQVLAEKISAQAPLDVSPRSSRRLTRSQAKQTPPKPQLKELPVQNERSPGSSGRKRRRRKEVAVDPKHGSESPNTHDCQASQDYSSPVLRSQAKELQKKASLQLRSRSVNRPRRLATSKPATRDMVADAETFPLKDAIDARNTPDVEPSTPTGSVLSPQTPSPNPVREALSPETPVGLAEARHDTNLYRILTSSLEKRKEQLDQEEFIPETPLAPKPSAIIPPRGKSVCRTLNYDN